MRAAGGAHRVDGGHGLPAGRQVCLAADSLAAPAVPLAPSAAVDFSGGPAAAKECGCTSADSKKGRTLSKARGIGAEMSGRRRDGAGQSGSFALGKGAGGCELQRKARCAPLAARTRPKKD